MASLFNTRISDTYVGLIKSLDNSAISATLKQLSDGSGNSLGIYVNTSGDFKVNGILEWGSLKDTGEDITITKFVDEADGIANNDNDTTIPTSAAIIDYVSSQITLEDLDFSGDSGSGSVDLDSQTFAIVGTTNEIETSASNQQLQIGIVTNPTLSGNVTITGDLNISQGEIINIGTDFDLYETATGAYIQYSSNPVIFNGSGDVIFRKQGSEEKTAVFTPQGSAKLYYDNSLKLETTTNGLTVTGKISSLTDPTDAQDAATKAYVDSQVGANNELSEVLANGNTTGGTDISVSTGDDITFADSSKAIFGAGSDLQIYHDGSNSYIKDAGTGDLKIQGANVTIETGGGNKYFQGASNVATLYHTNNPKLSTSAIGISVSGSATISSDLILSDYGSGTHTGTATQRLGVDSSGNVIEIPIGAGAVDGSGATGQASFWTDSDTISGDDDFYWDNTNKRLGIGTSSPNSLLTLESASSPTVRIKDTTNNCEAFLYAQNSNAHVGTQSNHNFIIDTNNTTAITIDTSQRVGIGESSPQEDLHITGDTPAIRFTDSDTSRDAQIVSIDGNLRFDADNNNQQASTNIAFRTDGTERMRIDSTGGVIFKGALASHQTNAGAIEYFSNQTSFKTYGATSGDGFFTFHTGGGGGSAGSERLRIENDGDIQIQTVGAQLRFQNSAGAAPYIKNSGEDSSTAPYGQNLEFYTGGAERMVIDSSGNAIFTKSGGAYLQLKDATAVRGAINVETSDGLVFTTGASFTERARFDSSGNFGLGVTSPVYPLDLATSGNIFARFVSSSTTSELNITSPSVNVLRIDTGSGDALTFATAGTERSRIDTSGDLQARRTRSNTAGEVALSLQPSDSTIHYGFRIDSSTNSFNLDRVDSAGNLLTIDASGNATFAGDINILAGKKLAYNSNSFITPENNTSGAEISTAGTFIVKTGSTPTLGFTIDTSQNVGIGTASPSNKVHIYGVDGTSYLRFTSDVATTGSRIGLNSDDLIIENQEASGDIIFDTNSTERARITSGGDVLLRGTYNPYSTSNRGNITMNGTASNIIAFTNGTAERVNMYSDQTNFEINNVISGYIRFKTNNTERLRITSGGEIQVGNAVGGSDVDTGTRISATQMRQSNAGTGAHDFHDFYRGTEGSLTRVGNIRTTGTSTAYNTSSDYRLKENVVKLTGALDRISQLKPSRFNFIADAETIVDGFLAHEVQDIVPEAITGEKDATEEYEVTPEVLDDEGNVIEEAEMGTRDVYQGIDQSKLVPLLVASIQELKAEIDELKKNK